MKKNNQNSKLLEVRNLNKIFVDGNSRVHAVNDVSFELNKGETIGLIGESGSGKTTIGRTIIRLNNPTSGQILLKGTNIAQKRLSKESKKTLRNNIQMIFQDPYSSLNEQVNIMNIIAEPIRTQKLDKKYFEIFSKDYDKVIEFYKYHLAGEINKLRWANAIKNEVFAFTEFSKETTRLKNFGLTSVSKWKEIESLTSLYWGVKIEGNATITNNSISVSDSILKLWDETKEKLRSGKVFFEDEEELRKAREKVERYSDVSKHVSEYYQYKKEYRLVKQYNKIFSNYIKDEKKSFKMTIKALSKIIKDQGADSLIKAKISKNIADYNFSILESKVKCMIANGLKEASGDIYSAEIEEKIDKFEKQIMISLLKIQKEVKTESKISISGFAINIDGEHIDLTVEWNKLLLSSVITEKDIVDDFIANRSFVLNEFSESERNYLKTLPLDNLGKMIIEEKALIAKSKEAKTLKPAVENLNKFKDAQRELVILQKNNYAKQKERAASFDLEQQKAKKRFEKEYKAAVIRKEKVVQETIILFDAARESIIKSDLPWFMNEEHKNPEAVFNKREKALRKHYADINLSLENETGRILKDNDMLRDAVVGTKFKKKRLKEYLVREKVFSVLEEAGLTKAHAFRYPHEFSGGMRQRVGIARAIVSQPDIIVADEPIAALDLSIQAQIANLLKGMQDKRGMSMIFIAHDLSMVKHISDRILIIHLGRIVESGTTKEIFGNPIHPYTKNLIASMPDIARISAGFENNNFEGKYLKEYSVVNQPEYIEVKDTHKVLATKDQFKLWIK